MDSLWQDIQFGARLLAKQPGFALVAILTLALGIGANTAMFSVVNAVLLRPLPYLDPDKLVMVWSTWVGFTQGGVSPPEYLDYREQAQSFQGLAAHASIRSMNITFGKGEPEQVIQVPVTSSLFPLLGARAALGRTFLPEEDEPGNRRVLLLSYGLWQRRFGGDPSAVGKSVQVDGENYTVVGVLSPDFQYPQPNVDVWRPLGIDLAARPRGFHFLRVLARRKPGTSLAQAQAEMDGLARRLQRDYPDNYPQGSGWGLRVVSLRNQLVGSARPALLILLGAVGFVLLIACANVANLMLARANARRREVAIRSALGASRWRLARQLLTEGILLGALGGLAGILLASWGLDFLIALSPGNIPRLREVGVDTAVLGFTLGVSLLTGLLSGLAAAIQGPPTDLHSALKEGVRGVHTAGCRRVRSLLVVSEIALAVMLAVGAGLLIQSFRSLRQVNPGIETENLLTADILLSHSKYRENRNRMTLFYDELLEKLDARPGIESAAAIDNPPFSGWNNDNLIGIEGRPPSTPGLYPDVEVRIVSSGYFRTAAIPLRRGRVFAASDNSEGQPVAIIDETLARKQWPGEDPVGQRFKFGGLESNGPWITIVGVVGAVRHGGLGEEIRPTLYTPVDQSPTSALTLLVRTAADPASLAGTLRNQVQLLDPEQPVSEIRTMEERAAASIAQPRFSFSLLSLFATLALALAAVGIYGVLAYAVGQRTQEIGIRLALGARPRSILALIAGQGMLLTLVGLGIGLVGALGMSRLLRRLLFGVSPTDPEVFALAALLSAAVALLACWLPARRATRVDPLVALRYE